MDNQTEECRKCGILEREMDNMKRTIDEMRIDMRGFQRVAQEVEIKYSRIETLITEKFLQITDALNDIKDKMNIETNNKKSNISLLIGQFIYPSLVSLVVTYVAWKILK
jgi:hypothetical protein